MQLILFAVGLVSLVVGAAYHLLPFKFGAPLVALLLGAWFVTLYVLTRDGFTAAESQPLAAALLVGLMGFLAGGTLATIRRRRRRQPVAA